MRSKDSPLILFHVKQKRLNAASDWELLKAFLWQWNIPGEKRDTFVGKGALKLPECCCLVTRLLRLLQPALKASARERTSEQLCKTESSPWVRPACVNYVPLRSYRTCAEVEEGGPGLHLAHTASTPHLSHTDAFLSQPAFIWNTVCQSACVCAVYFTEVSYHSTKRRNRCHL